MRIDNFLNRPKTFDIFSDQRNLLTYLWLDRWGHWPPCPEPRRPGVTMSVAALMMTMSVITWCGSSLCTRPPSLATKSQLRARDYTGLTRATRDTGLGSLLSVLTLVTGDNVWTMSPGLSIGYNEQMSIVTLGLGIIQNICWLSSPHNNKGGSDSTHQPLASPHYAGHTRVYPVPDLAVMEQGRGGKNTPWK